MIVSTSSTVEIPLLPHPPPVSAFAAELPPEQDEFEVHSRMFTAAGVFRESIPSFNGKLRDELLNRAGY